MLWPTVGAQLGAVDDHEIPVLEERIAAQGPVAVWLDTIDNVQGRFRPGYWAGRIIETAVWGQNVRGWYLDRLVLLAATIALGYLLARRWRPALPSALAALLMVAGPQAEAFYRLGPQESYAVPLTLAGFLLLSHRRMAGLAVLCAAATVKEPFVLMPIIGAAWAWRMGFRWHATAAAIIAAGIGLAILRSVLVNGGEFYTAQGRAIPLAGRYLYPAILAVALGIGLLVSRLPRSAILVAPVLIAGLAWAYVGARNWTAGTQAFAHQCASGTVPASDNPEIALAIERFGCYQRVPAALMSPSM